MPDRLWFVPCKVHSVLLIVCLFVGANLFFVFFCRASVSEFHLIWKQKFSFRLFCTLKDLPIFRSALQGHKWIWGNQEICGHKVSSFFHMLPETSNTSCGSNPRPFFLVAIYLGIKKRPSPGPSDVAGIWEEVGGETLWRWYWLCGRRRSDVAARSTIRAPFCSPAPMALQGAAWLLKQRCATFPRAHQRLLMGCATRDSGGHHWYFGTLPPKSRRTLNFEGGGGVVFQCVFFVCFFCLCVCVCKGN